MGKHLNLSDRIIIEIQIGRWSKQNEIAKVLKISKSSISRETSAEYLKKKEKVIFMKKSLF